MNKTLYRTLKMSLGFAAAVTLANLLNLDFPASAGIITMLNLSESKIESAKVAWRRFYSSIIGLILAVAVFSFFGYFTVNIALFLLIFIPVAIRLHAPEGIIVNTVLASHLLAYHEVTIDVLVNELSLVLLGGLVAMLLNLHMPDREKHLRELQDQVERHMRALLWTMSLNIRNLCNLHNETPSIEELESLIKEGKHQAYIYMNNYFLQDNSYYLEYFQMRQSQLYRLMYMREHLNMVFINQAEAIVLSRFTGRLAYEYDEENDGLSLKKRLLEIREELHSAPLPTSQLEFENRAALIQYLSDLDEFVSLKIRFSDRYPSTAQKGAAS